MQGFEEIFYRIERVLEAAMQLSIIVPMMVVWRRWRHFPNHIRSLSWYVYLSAISAYCARFSMSLFHSSNFPMLVGFNLGKTLLFGLVYYQVINSPKRRRLIVAVLPVASVIVISAFFYQPVIGMAVARITQCAVLAGFAMLYLDQYAGKLSSKRASHQSMWLLSVGQLIYSSVTVTSASLDYWVSLSKYTHSYRFMFIAIGGLAFNYFLTLAFLRANPDDELELASAYRGNNASSQKASSTL
jgi:hypothetical protein